MIKKAKMTAADKSKFQFWIEIARFYSYHEH